MIYGYICFSLVRIEVIQVGHIQEWSTSEWRYSTSGWIPQNGCTPIWRYLRMEIVQVGDTPKWMYSMDVLQRTRLDRNMVCELLLPSGIVAQSFGSIVPKRALLTDDDRHHVIFFFFFFFLYWGKGCHVIVWARWAKNQLRMVARAPTETFLIHLQYFKDKWPVDHFNIPHLQHHKICLFCLQKFPPEGASGYKTN
jgi:hypothetical protein